MTAYLCMIVCVRWPWSCLCSSPLYSSGSVVRLCCVCSWDRLLHFCGPTAYTAPCWSGSGGHEDYSDRLWKRWTLGRQNERYSMLSASCWILRNTLPCLFLFKNIFHVPFESFNWEEIALVKGKWDHILTFLQMLICKIPMMTYIFTITEYHILYSIIQLLYWCCILQAMWNLNLMWREMI